jgi:hypothetical protein
MDINGFSLARPRNRVKTGKNRYPIMHEIKNITMTPEILKLIAEIDEFTGRWKAMQTLAPERPPPDGAPIQGLNFSVGS